MGSNVQTVTPFQAGGRHSVGISGLADVYGVLQTSSNTACTVTITDVSGATIQPATAMSAGVAGSWTATVPASVFAYGNVLTVTVTVYDQTGAGAVRATFDLLAIAPLPKQVSYRRNALENVTLTALVDATGTPQSAATATAYLTVTSSGGATLLAATQMSFQGNQTWQYDGPATLLAAGVYVTVVVTIYDQTGSAGVQRGQYTLQAFDGG